MAPKIPTIESDPSLPERADVVVIGGGIIGSSTALFLAERGIDVLLCEKGRVAAEQSSRNWGWVRKMGRDPAEIPLSIESLRLWEGMNERTGAETGFRRAGIAYVCTTEKELAFYEDWAGQARQYQLDARLMPASEVAAMLPGTTRTWTGGLYTASDGRAEPQMAAPAIATAARAKGARIVQDCAVRGLETTAGRVSGVITEKGTVACDAVVLAGGAWSRLFCGNLGIDLPALKVLGSVMRTAPMEGVPEHAVGGGDFAFRKRLDGGYTIAQRNASVAEIVPDSFRLFFDFLPNLRTSWHELRLRVGGRFLEEWRTPKSWRMDEVTPFERVRTLDPVPAQDILDGAKRNLAEVLPAFRTAQIQESWGGLIDVTPDAVPVIGPVDALPGFYLATGFSGHGFGIGPGAGKLMADLVAGDTPLVSPEPFRFDRFARRAARTRLAAGLQATDGQRLNA
ncbi:NAD(P)/FAD-dependent oxidoreductase [Marinivivus vitaminiproducens]|uniref:NAD(P)/FAD-dependent oxidoreductase n=1 Tax=Marinivivus vitaminiproducens TaxID=3035935 RepID=UPI00279C35AC|nr:FAD-binding oxidoreductase [Geminicoccaceae bacterium SCSIO 64248]